MSGPSSPFPDAEGGPRLPPPSDARISQGSAPPHGPADGGAVLRTEDARRGALVRVAAPDLARRAQLDRTRLRLVVAAGGFAVLFLAVGVKLTLATIVDPAQPKLRAAPSVPQAEAVVARAPITDRNGEALAVSLRVIELYANPSEIGDPAAAADRLLTVLPNLDRERLIERITPRNVPGTERPMQFAYIHRNLTPRQTQAVNNLGVPGFHFRPAERRFFPQGSSAAHIIGQVGVEGNGLAGVERAFDQRLRGDPSPLRLSIDIRLQVAMRDAVQAAITDFNGIGGAGVIMDVHTGEVLAMVSLPDYDASDPMSLVRRPAARVDSAQAGQAGQQRRRRVAGEENDATFNRATVGVYEPGSTFKLFTAAMALDYGTVNVWGGYDASRPIRYGRFQIDDFKGKHRWLALPEIIAYSSNIASAHMAHAVGPQRHREFMQRMGMLNRLQVELPETARPLAPSPQGWRDINTMTIGFGHGISVTPLHVVTGVAALANGGILRQPTLVAQPPNTEREGTRVISERTSETMRRLMRLVVTDGSGKGAEVAGYFVGGKTGTAQKTAARGGYLENKRIAAFVGAFPMNAPRYAFYVMVDEPKPNARSHGYATAGWVAAPAAGSIIRRVAPILGLVPETERAPQIQQAIGIPMQPGRPAGTRGPGQAAQPAPGTPPRTAAAAPPPAPGTQAAAPPAAAAPRGGGSAAAQPASGQAAARAPAAQPGAPPRPAEPATRAGAPAPTMPLPLRPAEETGPTLRRTDAAPPLPAASPGLRLVSTAAAPLPSAAEALPRAPAR